jgi:PHD/YefM family antitoxin component YafN of YafNO toxin-antitoxin module
MVLANALLKADHVGIRELREHLSKRLQNNRPLIVTEHGKPTRVILSYRDILELVDILEELQDRVTLTNVHEGRKALRAGSKGIPVSRLFGKIRSANK